jgi:hypothetical protein
MVETPTGKCVFNAEICMGQKGFQFVVSCEKFKPHIERQQALNLEQIFFTKSEFSSHVSSTYWLKDSQDVFKDFF